MKKKILTALLAGTLIIGLSTVAYAGASIKMFYNGQEIKADISPINMNGRILAPVRALAEAMGAKVNWDKESNQVNIIGNDQNAQIRMLEHALAPKSTLDAVISWAQGVQTRNGAWQYAVMTPEMKKQSYEECASLNWVTGVSSPWIKDFKVSVLNDTEDNEVLYSVTFTWTDSTNSTSETTQFVTVKNIEGTWLVDSIDNLDDNGQITNITLGDDKKVL